MTLTPQDALELCKKMRMDLTQLQGRLTDVMEALAAMPEPPTSRCPVCGVPTRGPLSLAEHLHNSHGEPLPDHWIRAEQLAGVDTLPTTPDPPIPGGLRPSTAASLATDQ